MLYYFIGAIILMLAGVIGVIIPAIPGIPLMAVVALLYQIFTRSLPTWALIILSLITVGAISIDYFSGILGARISGASAKSTLLGLLGMFVGIGFVPPFGAILGLFAGILIGELFFQKNTKKAVRAASGGALSVLIGMVLNLILAFIFLAVFIIGAIRGL